MRPFTRRTSQTQTSSSRGASSTRTAVLVALELDGGAVDDAAAEAELALEEAELLLAGGDEVGAGVVDALHRRRSGT